MTSPKPHAEYSNRLQGQRHDIRHLVPRRTDTLCKFAVRSTDFRDGPW
jgi:hypothetical protein